MFSAGSVPADTAHVLGPTHGVGGGEGRGEGWRPRLDAAGGPEVSHVVGGAGGPEVSHVVGGAGGGGGEGGGRRSKRGQGICVRLHLNRTLRSPEWASDAVYEVAVHHVVLVGAVVDVDPADPYVQLKEVVNVAGDHTTM